jgi:catechol 2,3-dioxygenase-like lactoylglutathione lyase family enzyme
MASTQEPRIESVFTVGVPVSDQDRALDFYVRTLGMTTLMDAPVENLGGRWIVVAPEGSPTTLALVPASDATPAGVPTGVRFATSDAAGLRTALAGQGLDVGELLEWPGIPPMFTLRDPDGNGFSVTET